MSKPSANPVIRLRGMRHNNLKNFDLDLPLNQLVVVTGLSGSGKSSLAFDTLFAEGQRRYIETFSPYARQFFDRMDKPQVDSIEGIPPAIAIEQRNSVKTTRSTVGTMTEICDYMKVLWPQVARLHCRTCGRPVMKDSPQQIWHSLADLSAGNEVVITFELPLTEKLSLNESLALVSKQGYQRLLFNNQIVRVDEVLAQPIRKEPHPASLTVIQDRLKLVPANRARFVEAAEQAYHFGKGKLTVWEPAVSLRNPRFFSNRLHCAQCDIEYREPSSALFSFNHPVGACPTCRGFGRVISIDYNLALPDRAKTIAQGVVKPWQTGHGQECQTDLLRVCRQQEIPIDTPFERLPKKLQTYVIEGEPGYGTDEDHQWPRAWYGVKGYFRWLESKAYKMHVRVLLSRYRAYTACPDCQGQRFQPEALLYRSQPTPAAPAGLTLADFYLLPVRDAAACVQSWGQQHQKSANDPVGLALNEVSARLGYLNEVGLGYLTLDRPTRSLSGGETERVNLTTCLGTRLVNTLFVLDEPSVGLHPRDTERLVRILQQLRDAGNTVVVVEHEPSLMRAADQIVDLGPGHGATGGEIVFQGPFQNILKASGSLTGLFLSGREKVEIPRRRPVTGRGVSNGSPVSLSLDPARSAFALNDTPATSRTAAPCPFLRLTNASRHNIKELSLDIPLGRLVCLTGVSGSGKTTLARELLLPALAARLKTDSSDPSTEPNGDNEDSEEAEAAAGHAVLEGSEHLGGVVLVDQSILGKTPRSNPAVYIGAFEDIRDFFAQSEVAKQRGLNSSAFSFNSPQGQCERCRGAGFEKIEMQFLSDVFIRCADCDGRRYRSHILEVKIGLPGWADNPRPRKRKGKRDRTDSSLRPLSIGDLLESTVEEAIRFLDEFPFSRPALRAASSLRLLEEVGLGYLKLGQPINTLSGGESQRLKLVRHLATVEAAQVPREHQPGPVSYRLSPPREAPLGRDATQPKPLLFLFDEPTTGLHFDDVRRLLKVFHRLVDAGHSVLVIEHNLDVIKSADWIIDLGPDAGDQGGQVVAQGIPEQVAANPGSHTGTALKEVLAPNGQPIPARCE